MSTEPLITRSGPPRWEPDPAERPAPPPRRAADPAERPAPPPRRAADPAERPAPPSRRAADPAERTAPPPRRVTPPRHTSSSRRVPPRTCVRSGCAAAAAAALAYRYATREAWLLPLPDEPHPALYDLCHEHACRVRAPMGWSVRDERDGVATGSRAPATDDRAAERGVVPDGGRDGQGRGASVHAAVAGRQRSLY